MATYAVTTSGGTVFPVNPPKNFYGAVCTTSSFTYLEPNELWLEEDNPLNTAIPNKQITTLYDSTGITVSSKFFGYHWHNWPNTSISSITNNIYGEAIDNSNLLGLTARSHDHSPNSGGSLRWHAIETSKGVFYWDNFDEWRDTHYALGRDLIFTIFGCPAWATGTGSGDSHYNNGANPYSTSNPPTDMDDWSDYCTAVATRGLGKIKYYQVWNEANVGTSWFNGTKAQLAEMHKRAWTAIKAVDPTALIVACPMAGGLDSPSRTYFDQLMGTAPTSGGVCSDYVDIIALHLYQNTSSTSWKTWTADLATFKALLPAHGLENKEIWYTEFGLSNPLIVDIDFSQAKARLARMIIQMAVGGISRVYLYSMDSASYGYFYAFKKAKVTEFLNELLTDLQTGAITRVNLLWNGQIAYLKNGEPYIA